MVKSKKQKDVVKVVGTPTMLFLPARNYKFNVDLTDYVVTIPRRGSYKDLDAEMFTDEDGDFDILSKNKDGDYIVYMPSLSRVLFAVSKYPKMEDHQAFTPIAVVVREDEVDIVGNIIDMIHGK